MLLQVSVAVLLVPAATAAPRCVCRCGVSTPLLTDRLAGVATLPDFDRGQPRQTAVFGSLQWN
jgi:hypothetical protein